MKALLLILIFALSFKAQANINLKVSIEGQLEERIKKMVTPIDPYAQIFVKVTLKKISTPLPGTSLELLNVSQNIAGANLDFDDIETVDLRLMTSLDKFPNWLKEEVSRTVNFPGVKSTYKFDVLDAQSKAFIEDQLVLNKAATKFEAQFKDLSLFFYGLGGLLLVLFGFLTFWLMSKTPKIFEQQIDRLVEGLAQSDLSDDGPSVIDVSSEQNSLSNGNSPMALGAGSDDLEQMSTASLVGLFSDCYWCEQDNYAAWIWAKLVTSQRSELLSQWDVASEYVKTLTTIPGEDLGLHNHPHYLNPSALENLSQQDVSDWIKKSQSAWHVLSPIRQSTLPLSLSERIKCVQSNVEAKVTIPTSSSTHRELQVLVNFGQLSLEDELAIVEDPSLVPEALRSEIPSLVWLSMIEEGPRGEILAKLSAQDLAAAFIGPDSVLEKLKEVIPEKKMKLVHGYTKKIMPSRNSVAFKFLIDQSINYVPNENQPDETSDEETFEEAV